MKKLMIAAAAAAMIGGAYADICAMAPAQKTCRAYDFAASVKLVDGKIATDKASNVCDKDGKVYYRVKATRKIKGVFTDCNPCMSWVDSDGNGTLDKYDPQNAVESLLAGEAAGGATFYVATSAQKYKKVYNASFYDDGDATSLVDGYKFLLLNYFGGTSLAKSKYAEGLLYTEFVEMDQYNEERAYSLLCAGFGARDGKMLKNLAGNLAGAVAAATWCGIPTIVWEPCLETAYYTDLTFAQDGTFTVTLNPWKGLSTVSPNYDAVSGTWSLKYNASKSKLATFDALMQKTFGKDWELFAGAAAPVFPMTLANVVLN